MCICFLFFACSQKSKFKNENSVLIEYDKIDDLGKDSNLITNVEYIPLSTTDESLIGKVCRVIFRNDSFYVFDFFINNSVLVFDRFGEFTYKIENIGKGPGEYISASDIDVDGKGNVYLFDAGGSRNIIRYSKQGEEWSYIKPPKGFIEFKFVNNDKILAYLPFSKTGIDDCYGIINLKNNNYYSVQEKRDVIDDNQYFNELSHIFRTNNSCFFSPRFTNRIYKIQENLITEEYRFSDDVLPPEEFIMDLMTKKITYRDNQEYIISISGIYETENTVAISFKDRTKKQILISKKTDKVYALSNVQNCLFWNNFEIYGSTGNKFIALASDLNIDDIMNSCLDIDNKAALTQRTMNSNPVLVLFEVKDF